MAYEAKVLADSVTERGDRLTTFEVTLPRIVLPEFLTHRMLSRNSASSRAIPTERQLLRILDGAFVPETWGMNQPGMQASGELPDASAALAEQIWLEVRDYAMIGATALIGGVGALKNQSLGERIMALRVQRGYNPPDTPSPGVHKQLASRLIEPFMEQAIVVSATDLSNFFALRDNPEAQPEIQRAAHLMRSAYEQSQPRLLHAGEWHLPFIQEEDRALGLPVEQLAKMAVARCARVSYLTHDTGTRDPAKDLELYERLVGSGHMSPLEHVARPMADDEFDPSHPYSGNFRGWHQYRKDVADEDDFSRIARVAE